MSDAASADTPSVPALSAGGTRLLAFLDRLPVETEWIAGHRVVWQTGQQDGPDRAGPEDHTHCSALVAAVALDLDIYVLRPPHHAQELLANAQVAWLGGTAYPGPSAAMSGWRGLGSSGGEGTLARAVAAANAGKLVIGGYRQPPVVDPITGASVERPGHVVVVRPQTGTIPTEAGPLVTMASDRNWRMIRMDAAFGAHPGAWPDSIHLFVHDTDLEPDFPAADGVG